MKGRISFFVFSCRTQNF